MNRILVPLDCSTLAECVLPHVAAIAPITHARVTLAHVMEPLEHNRGTPAVDPVEWHVRKQNAEMYLKGVANRLRESGIQDIECVNLEGVPSNSVIDFARNNDVDLIALSTHGQSGLSGWNVSSVVQKILLRAYKSILLVRAYLPSSTGVKKVQYKRLFVGMDCSQRSEFVLPYAVSLAQFHKSHLLLECAIQKPQCIHRFPLSTQDTELLKKLVERNYQAASRYLQQLVGQFSTEELRVSAHVAVGDNAVSILHDRAEKFNADLVLLAAHGHTGERRWPYGSVATSFIAYDSTSLMIFQDLQNEEIHRTRAELAVVESKGH